jgi:ABC-type nickel/cobalt efflux system permease component RcnA
MMHAIEADHLAAVATLMNRKEGKTALMARGAFWGLGHTLALFFICGTVVLLGLTLSTQVEASLELVVGLMILTLGLRVLWRLRADDITLDVHSHDGKRHFHAHARDGADPAGAVAHVHRHRTLRGHVMAMCVGLVHGAAGSAGLLVLTVAATDSLSLALAYFAVFGIGSLAGMAVLTFVASYPLEALERRAGWLRRTASVGIGGLSTFVGGSLAFHSAQGLGVLGL